MDNELKIKRAYEYMLNVHQNEPTGHDVVHIERVYNCALYIAQQEGIGNTLVIELVALLHDTVDYKLTDSQLALKKLKHFFTTLKLSDEELKQILYIIENMNYRGGKNNSVKLSAEGQIVRDADRLDAIGAIGIARTFQFAGHHGEPMWTEHEISFKDLKIEQIEHFDNSVIKHFYEKLLKLKDLMHTPYRKKTCRGKTSIYAIIFKTDFKGMEF